MTEEIQTPIRIVGIDPGFDRLGICVLDKEGVAESLIFSTCITTEKKDSFPVRLTFLAQALEKIITHYKPHELAIETIFITKNQKTVINVAEVRGVCIYLCHLHNISVHEYSPPQIKVAITGYGKATKDDIAYMVPKILKKTLELKKLDDELDAIAIALTHSAHRKMSDWDRM
jgi:crossover junction endodeoxyribonuclease RuvC